jgi:hypothetical protein
MKTVPRPDGRVTGQMNMRTHHARFPQADMLVNDGIGPDDRARRHFGSRMNDGSGMNHAW